MIANIKIWTLFAKNAPKIFDLKFGDIRFSKWDVMRNALA